MFFFCCCFNGSNCTLGSFEGQNENEFKYLKEIKQILLVVLSSQLQRSQENAINLSQQVCTDVTSS